MKLILTSKDFLNENSKKIIFENLGIKKERCKILFIPNEKFTIEKFNSKKYLKRLKNYGFVEENIYIFNYQTPEIYKDLNIDAIYVGGGNTFEILELLKKSNFDKEIIKYVEDGVLYIGGSAGTHIVTQNIEHIKYFDYCNENLNDYNAIGLFDGIIFCHYTEEREKIYLKYKNNSIYKVFRITDAEAIIVDGDEIIKK